MKRQRGFTVTVGAMVGVLGLVLVTNVSISTTVSVAPEGAAYENG